MTNTFEYNERGLNTSVSIIDSKNTSNTAKITASAAYTENGNFMASQTDTMGNTTTYNYDTEKSLLNSVTVGSEEKPSVTSYTYDAMNRTTAVENGDSKVSYVYDDDYLTTITHRNTYNAATDTELNTIYQFDYGNFGLLNKIIVGDDDESTVDEVEETALITHEYDDEDSTTGTVEDADSYKTYNLLKSVYGNNHSIEYTYDDQFRTKSITYDDGITTTPPVLAVEYEYDNNGNLGVLKDHLGNRTVKYLYDAADRLMKVQSQYLNVGWEYDDLNNLTQQKYTVDESYFTYNLRGKADVVTSYTYDKDNRPTKITSQVTDKNNTYNAGLVSANYTYDGYGRNNVTTYKHGTDTTVLTKTIGYVNPTADRTTSVVHTLRNLTDLYDKTYTYTYDAQGNITSISDSSGTITYEYDELNQLIRENNPITGETWVYTYDLGGNITSKTKYDYTTAANPTNGEEPIVYVYGDPNWPDLLTKYNNQEIESDAIGNMLSDGTWEYHWQNGRQLAGMTKDGTEIEYTYDSDGMRTSKTVNGTTTKYMYHGGQLVAMDTEFGPVYFHYDSSGVMAMEVQGTMLYYVKNSQGDVVALIDTNGYPVVEYTYDAWGNIHSIDGIYATTYGLYNPFRYRGYVYDTETGLYYLQSRYYNPNLGRFICTDNTSVLVATPTAFTDKNLFAYCDNNPVSRSDSSGNVWISIAVGAVSGLVSGVAEQFLSDKLSGTKSSFKSYALSALGGAIGGAVSGAFGGFASKIGEYAAKAIGGTVASLCEAGFGALCGTNDRSFIEVVAFAFADGALSMELPIIGEAMGLSGNKLKEFLANIMNGKVGNFFKDVLADLVDGAGTTVWDAAKSVAPSSQSLSLGRSLGYKVGETYYYNGLRYTCY